LIFFFLLEAQLQWKAAVSKRPNDAWLLASLAASLRASGHFEESFEHASSALKLDPSQARVWLLR
jgi:hypothetical protein